jgi:hypothetical protein
MRPPVTSTRITVLPIAIAAVLSLAACGGSLQAAPTQPTASDPTPTATTTQPPSERVFTMPTECAELLPGSVQADFTAQGLELLGGPGGKYPQYYSDPTPEEAAGGISCIWGNEEVPESTVTVSVAPLSTDTRGEVVDSLLAQGLNEAVIDDGVSYAQIGDDTSAPAILNVLRDDSWISVIEAIGGEAFFTEAVELANQAAEQVYR